jgi:menaquinol-cytochrome c reductase cytochrome b/c subunit
MSALDERRAGFQRYKQDVKERGKPFYPYAMFHDTVMSLVVVCVIVGLACVWYFTSHEDPNKCDPKWTSCTLGPRYAEPADPGTTNFVPRPDWYFYFLFYLLRIFKWPDSVILGTVGIPTLLLIIALALPFLDTGRERRLSRRPVAVVAAILVVISMGELTYKGAVAKEALASEVVAAVPQWAQRQGFADNPQAVAGAKVFAQAGCTSCHTYLGTGGGNLGAPDLSAEGTKGKGVDGLEAYVADPSKFGNTVMPKFGAFKDIPAKDANGKDLGISQLRALAIFLDASKGPK